MRCEEKHSLAKKYSLYVRAYQDAVEQLSLSSAAAAKADWDLAYAIASRARQLSEDARRQLHKHVEEHHCDGPLPTSN
jgi:hypothetical protein